MKLKNLFDVLNLLIFGTCVYKRCNKVGGY